ncbi:V-set and immunoglobulin domain-containing protein 10-like 2 isoform X2 [Callorhinchus milii]|nr:V-set and immunoglobulin domain-containing protein 10-like 2 isoform X2 [Callorhinchus milii]XP_042199820.1 V-set and immunoglobulin domain-containing protein 10-like 2 isoform X2 [Callorhinchus milii]XP_042199821.1 V-set and immunoglobulin domain-containing protein 10-like 2 isoform X2 [Callorhinchus milii]|eukprot:gi/632956840/ref/XP_007894158.1/ PREDICTED: V-set and immunoglobulin domain-containing protein 10-like isoform X2 [Callorhinchus milii]
MFDTEEVQYIETQVKGVIGHSVVLECGESLPSIYIWGFSRTGFIDIRAVLYNYGQGAKLQKMASIFGDVRVVSDSAALVISNLQLAAEGRFTCQSLYETDDGTKLVYTFVNVFVLIPVSKPFIELSNSSPVEGSVAFVLCTVENGTQPLEYTWTRQSTLSKKFVNVSEATGGLVNLTSVHRNHTGWYTCSVRSEVNEESSDPLWLEVIFGPDEPFINVTPYTLNSMGYSAIEWDTIFLTCSASSNPPSHYIWFYNNSQIYSGQRFVIKKISRSQAGAYMCLAQNSALNARTKTTIILTVYYLPDGKPTCTVLAVNNYQDVALWCSWQGGHPAAGLQWLEVKDGIIDVMEYSSLTKVKAGEDILNNSTYTCHPSHPALRSDLSCRTTALLPEEQPKCSATAVKNNEYTMLSCSWEGGLPLASLQWKNWRNQPLGNLERSINNQVLKSTTAYNGKDFVCQAAHPLTSDEMCSVRLEAPVLVTPRSAMTVFEGSDVHLTCILQVAYPVSEIIWYNNRNESIWLAPKKYQLHQEVFWSNLTVRETDGNGDSGPYWCTALNVVGYSTLVIRLHVKKYPTPPNVTISKLLFGRQRTEVLLEWTTRGSGDLTGFLVQRQPVRRSVMPNGRTSALTKEEPHHWETVVSAVDADIRGHKLGGQDPSILYAFRILAVNHRTTGFPSEVKTPADPPFNAFPAVIGAAVAGMLLAAVTTLLIFQYVVRNRDNNPWLHNLLFRLRPPSESREEINFPEDAEIAEIPLPAERNENIGTVPPQFTQESEMSPSDTGDEPLTTSTTESPPSSECPITGTSPHEEDEQVNVVITVTATT